jgi:hypothetical protein
MADATETLRSAKYIGRPEIRVDVGTCDDR